MISIFYWLQRILIVDAILYYLISYILYILLVLILNYINCNVTYFIYWNYYNIDNLLILISYIPFDILLYGSNILINFNSIYLFIEQFIQYNIIPLIELLLKLFYFFFKEIFWRIKFSWWNGIFFTYKILRSIHFINTSIYKAWIQCFFNIYDYAYVVSQYCNA